MSTNQTKGRNGKRNTNPPKLIAYHVADQGRGRKFWTRLGAVWEHKNGDGLTVFLNTLPVEFDGRVVLLPPRDDEDGQAEKGQDSDIDENAEAAEDETEEVDA